MRISQRVWAVAEQLVAKHNEEWGGKTNGRYVLARESLIKMLGVPRLHPETLRELTDACLLNGLVLIDLDTSFGVVTASVSERWRKLPRVMAEKVTAELDGERETEAALAAEEDS